MALPSSGTISASQINVELGRSATAVCSLNGAAERAIVGINSGTISLAQFRGRSLRWSPNPLSFSRFNVGFFDTGTSLESWGSTDVIFNTPTGISCSFSLYKQRDFSRISLTGGVDLNNIPPYIKVRFYDDYNAHVNTIYYMKTAPNNTRYYFCGVDTNDALWFPPHATEAMHRAAIASIRNVYISRGSVGDWNPLYFTMEALDF